MNDAENLIDKKKLIRTLWFLSWIIIIFIVVLKLVFNKWFPIIVENYKLMCFSKDLDNTKIIKYLIFLSFYLLNGNMLYLTSSYKKKYKNKIELLIINILIIISYIIKLYFNYYSLILELIIIIIIPIYNLFKYNKYNKLICILHPILVQVITILWQANILFARNLPHMLDNQTIVVQIILQIDYYIFIIVMYIGEVNGMGLIGFWLFGKDKTTIQAMIEKEEKKSKPNQKKLDKLYKALEKCGD